MSDTQDVSSVVFWRHGRRTPSDLSSFQYGIITRACFALSMEGPGVEGEFDICQGISDRNRPDIEMAITAMVRCGLIAETYVLHNQGVLRATLLDKGRNIAETVMQMITAPLETPVVEGVKIQTTIPDRIVLSPKTGRRMRELLLVFQVPVTDNEGRKYRDLAETLQTDVDTIIRDIEMMRVAEWIEATTVGADRIDVRLLEAGIREANELKLSSLRNRF